MFPGTDNTPMQFGKMTRFEQNEKYTEKTPFEEKKINACYFQIDNIFESTFTYTSQTYPKFIYFHVENFNKS